MCFQARWARYVTADRCPIIGLGASVGERQYLVFCFRDSCAGLAPDAMKQGVRQVHPHRVASRERSTGQ
jgi:hypothetical protein